MPTKQRVILVTLLILSVLQQGVRWKLHRHEPLVSSTAEAAAVELEQKHCPLVHINTAGMAELQSLPGIGPVLAERIIVERKEQPFFEKRDLLRVPGIGEKRLAQLVDFICLYIEDDGQEH